MFLYHVMRVLYQLLIEVGFTCIARYVHSLLINNVVHDVYVRICGDSYTYVCVSIYICVCVRVYGYVYIVVI